MFEDDGQGSAKIPAIERRVSRRHMMQSLLGVCAAALLARSSGADMRKDLVEINGWILKRSDLA
jgi:hypothetical protein